MKTTKKKIKKRKSTAKLGKGKMTLNILESIPDAVVVTDLQGRILQFNQALTRNYGYGKEVIGRPVFDIFLTKEDLLQAAEALMKVIKEGTMRNFECLGMTKDKRKIPMLINLALLKNPKNVPLGIIAVTRDISELKRVQEELEKAKSELEEKVKERTKELREKVEELERFHKLAVGRELKMIELKEETERLKEELEKYKERS